MKTMIKMMLLASTVMMTSCLADGTDTINQYYLRLLY